MLEKEIKVRSGGVTFVWIVLFLLATIALTIYCTVNSSNFDFVQGCVLVTFICILYTAWIILIKGFFILQPNEAAALVLFGA
jgi:hypothetical protein